MTSKAVQLSIFLFFAAAVVCAQDFTRKVEGRVLSVSNDVSAVHVSNITKNKGTITNFYGYFEISVQLGDSLVFSAVQFKRKEVVVTPKILNEVLLLVPLEDSLTELDEVVVTPYNLSGDLNRDMGNMQVEPVVTASSLGLPNAYVKVKTQNERKLFEADDGPWVHLGNYKLDTTFNPMIMVNLNKILNRISGRTQKLKKYVAIDKEIELLRTIKRAYPDSVYVRELKISNEQLNEFFYFCEADTTFTSIAETGDRLRIWEFLEDKSNAFRSNKSLAQEE